MNDKNLGIALTAGKLSITNKTVFIPKSIYNYTEEEFNFKNGGYTPVSIGEVARGVTSGATAIVIGVNPTMGKWEDSNMSGTIRIKSRSGEFVEGESLSVGPEADRVNITSLPEPCSDSYKFKGEKAKAVYVAIPISKDSLIDHAAVTIAVSGNILDYNYPLGVTIPEGKKWCLYGDEIEKANFLSYAQGAKSTIEVVGYF